jgi:RNA polymerase sigma factor (sigma-70 family)
MLSFHHSSSRPNILAVSNPQLEEAEYNSGMSSADRRPQCDAGPDFATTHWSLVLAAGQRASPQSCQALATLCEAYWYPLYAHVRRRGYRADEAQDLIQEFFTRLLEKEYLRMADRGRGRFRSFLLAAVDHFLAKEWRRAHALKRGGQRVFVSLDFTAAEGRYGSEPSHDLTPDKLYQRRWALTLVDQVLARLRCDFAQGGKLALFDRLKHFLGGEGEGEGGTGSPSYQQVAAELGMTEGAVKVAVHRLRRQCGELLRQEIARTVDGAQEVDAELRDLFGALT